MARSRKRKTTGETTQLFRPSKPQKIKKRRFWPYFFLVILTGIAGYYFWIEFFALPTMPIQLIRPGKTIIGDQPSIKKNNVKESPEDNSVNKISISPGIYNSQTQEKDIQSTLVEKPSRQVQEIPTTIQRNIQVEILNGCGVQGMAAKFAQILRKKNIDVVSTGNYKSLDVKNTQIIDRIGNKNFAAQIANILKVNDIYVYTQINKKLLIDATVIIGKDYNNLKMK